MSHALSSIEPRREHRLCGFVAAVSMSSLAGCQREADPALDLYIMPLYVVGMVPFAVSVGVRDIYAASRGSRVFSGVVAALYVAASVALISYEWPRTGVFALLVALASGVLAGRAKKA